MHLRSRCATDPKDDDLPRDSMLGSPSSSSSDSPSPCVLIRYSSNTFIGPADKALYGCSYTSSKQQADVHTIGPFHQSTASPLSIKGARRTLCSSEYPLASRISSIFLSQAVAEEWFAPPSKVGCERSLPTGQREQWSAGSGHESTLR
ncbi:putative golgin subfamily A member 6-like protein 1 [Sesbania bispinosa]|nr:putative golgin subfamily A member 6-like protein 1 [Sesbania bispinosa]